MSIPDRLYKIAKYKLTELVDHFDQFDRDEGQTSSRSQPFRADARRELEDALANPAPRGNPDPYAPDLSGRLPERSEQPRVRTPQEIAAGVRLNGASAPGGQPSSGSAVNSANTPDPLSYHYRLLGVEPGADFATVQSAYSRFAARCEPSRFIPGSEDERQAASIRKRLEDSYRVLREALDPTARRFDLLEFDDKKGS